MNHEARLNSRLELRPDFIKSMRKATGLNQAEFGRSIGLGSATVYNWENGKRRPNGASRILLLLIAEGHFDMIRRTMLSKVYGEKV